MKGPDASTDDSLTAESVSGAVLGVDPGGRRYGVAIADLTTRFARPLEVIDARQIEPVERLAALAGEHRAHEIVVGKPVGLSGREGPAVDSYADFVARLKATGLEVHEYDERFTTTIAEQGLKAGGAKRKARDEIKDAVAAQVMLQGWLDSI